MLEIVKVNKSFGDKQVLNDCSLEVNDGQIFGLVGINGAGKSTLLRCIAGIYECDKGGVFFEESDVYLEPNVRKDIIFISDDLYYTKHSTLKSLKEFYETFYDLNEDDFYKYVNLFGLDVNKPIANFSKGMKRQAFLVFALAIKPKLLLLDEAFDGLDPLVRLNFRKALVDIIEDRKTTIIISSHNLKELEDICDSFGILEDGKITKSGDLKANKELVNKYQLVFNEEVDRSLFTQFDLMHFSTKGRVATVVIRGEEEVVTKELEALNPILIDVLNVNFEEMFIYEMEARGEVYES